MLLFEIDNSPETLVYTDPGLKYIQVVERSAIDRW